MRIWRRLPTFPATVIGLLTGLFLWFSGCAARPVAGNSPSLHGPPPKDRITIMAYNIENFFDDIHDPDRDDFAFLPLQEKKHNVQVEAFCHAQKVFRRKECFTLNWDETAVKTKIKAVAGSILQVYGHGPDILLLEEVEGLRILNRLNDEGLGASAGYKTVVWLRGHDRRGIAVGLMSRFPLAGEPRLHDLIRQGSTKPKETRGILEVPLKLPTGQIFTVFGVHLPSQFNPVGERQQAISQLRSLVQTMPPDALWMIGGDWNITAREDRDWGLIENQMREVGLVSHQIGCRNCVGTHFYKGVWNFFDILVFSKNFASNAAGPVLIPESIQTPRAGPDQVDTKGRPRPFHVRKGRGVSDHLPIYAEIKLPKDRG